MAGWSAVDASSASRVGYVPRSSEFEKARTQSSYCAVSQLEGEGARVETPKRERLEVPRDVRPNHAEEGEMLVGHENSGEVTFTVDYEVVS